MLRRLQTPFSCLPGVSSGGGGIGGGASGAGKEVPAALGELVIKTGDKETQRSRRNNSWILLDFLEFLLDPPPPSPRTGPNPHIPDPPELRPLPPSPPSHLSSLVAAAATAMIHLFFPRACLCFSYVRVLLNSVYFVLSHIARAAFPLQGHCACVCLCVRVSVRACVHLKQVSTSLLEFHTSILPNSRRRRFSHSVS